MGLDAWRKGSYITLAIFAGYGGVIWWLQATPSDKPLPPALANWSGFLLGWKSMDNKITLNLVHEDDGGTPVVFSQGDKTWRDGQWWAKGHNVEINEKSYHVVRLSEEDLLVPSDNPNPPIASCYHRPIPNDPDPPDNE